MKTKLVVTEIKRRLGRFSGKLGKIKMTKKTVTIFLLIFMVVLSISISSAETTSSATAKPEDFLIIGHMGAPMEEPDNTIESFQKALELGANAIETDICMTQDGVLVLWHDWNPDALIAKFRQLGKQGLKCRPYVPDLAAKFRRPLPRLTLKEFRANYGYTLRSNGLGTRQKLPNKIPTLEEFCQWASNQPNLEKIFFDIKIPKAYQTWVKVYFSKMDNLLEKWNLKNKVVCLIASEEIFQEAIPIAEQNNLNICFDRELPPVLILHPSKFSTVDKAIQNNLSWASIGKPVCTFLGYKIFKKIIAEDQKKLKVFNQRNPSNPLEGIVAWTIDKPDEMKELIKMGVKGIITNRPETLKKQIDEMQKK